jgi:hypothetical protein
VLPYSPDFASRNGRSHRHIIDTQRRDQAAEIGGPGVKRVRFSEQGKGLPWYGVSSDPLLPLLWPPKSRRRTAQSHHLGPT